ncbi:hypothetical protein [Kitasatospora cheerisanensis]|uniref:Uncharacterized protein n=1 Tax=Kitasatospora cheerisanensis KCTC 2395 TaxID=1348663 RepID=A0A066Z618_9ACTN|nr:hypothetical protein [Kitasatospora cheerisanensis]KDN85620.1 hypothetical protein KCH_26370 [Kitasatospora cheerisanensis KCTC 2395]
MTDHQVSSNQVYEACHPGDGKRRIRIIAVHGNRAEIETIGRRSALRRFILLNTLHASATTSTGRPRRTGYRLVGLLGEPPERSPTT